MGDGARERLSNDNIPDMDAGFGGSELRRCHEHIQKTRKCDLRWSCERISGLLLNRHVCWRRYMV